MNKFQKYLSNKTNGASHSHLLPLSLPDAQSCVEKALCSRKTKLHWKFSSVRFYMMNYIPISAKLGGSLSSLNSYIYSSRGFKHYQKV